MVCKMAAHVSPGAELRSIWYVEVWPIRIYDLHNHASTIEHDDKQQRKQSHVVVVTITMIVIMNCVASMMIEDTDEDDDEHDHDYDGAHVTSMLSM